MRYKIDIMGKLIIDLKDAKNENIFHFLSKNAKICVVDFYADWCGPCLKLGEDLEKKLPNQNKIYENLLMPDSNYLLEQEKVKDKIAFIKINIDAFGDLAEQFRVISIPHVIFYKDGVIKSEISRNCDQIFNMVNKLLA